MICRPFENLAKSLGNMTGILEYDALGGCHVLHNFTRIWVRLDIREPLMRRKKLHRPKGSYFGVTFSYERICRFAMEAIMYCIIISFAHRG